MKFTFGVFGYSDFTLIMTKILYNVEYMNCLFMNYKNENKMDIYKSIKTKENYDKLLASGMFWEFHPKLSGNWEKDKDVINK